VITADVDGNRIAVYFHYDQWAIDQIKKVPGSRFVKSGKYWTIPLDLLSARKLREVYGDLLTLAPDLTVWGWRQVAQERNLTSLASAGDADLARLPTVLPGLFQTLRDYQRAAALFIATCANPLVADQPGLGKTLETIAGIHEANLDYGAHLVVCPITAFESVWQYELERFQEWPVMVLTGDRGTKLGMLEAIQEVAISQGRPIWVVCNPHMVRYEKLVDADGAHIEVPSYEALHKIDWKTIIVDECHKGVLNNPKTLTAKGLYHLHGEKRIALSGTPFGGKPINLWGILHWLEPKLFSSKWRWAESWLEIEETHWGKKIQGIQNGKDEAFAKSLQPFMLRRTKADVLKELPPKQYMELWVEMEPSQREQYVKFALDAEIKIDEEKLSATSILAEYTRLKQFAGARQKILRVDPDTIQVFPTEFSCKLPYVQQILDELGIWEADTDEQCVIFSQFAKMVDMVHEWLNKKKVLALKLTGMTKERNQLVKDFQTGRYPVLVMSTTAGGTAITLDRASTVVFLDETWNPDDQTQAEDRIHRASRMHQVMIYKIQTKGTVEEYIARVLKAKSDINDAILDLRRSGVRSYPM
jgi:SNF2 family DNA or RNA helicase